jgi:hypothetical protein
MASAKSAYRREHTGTRQGDGMQRLAQDTARSAGAHPTNGARLLDTDVGGVKGAGLAFTAGTPRSIAHGLGRKATGFFEVYGVDAPSAARVGLFASAHPSGITSSTHITLTPTSTGTCFVMVF